MGSNFNSWYWKLKVILEHEQILFVLIDPAPEEPTPNTRSTIWDTYQKWLNDRTTVRCIILAAMNDKFNRKFENAQPQDILQILNESFNMSTMLIGTRQVMPSSTLEWEKGHQSLIMYYTWSRWLSAWVSSTFSYMSSWGRMPFWTLCLIPTFLSLLIIEW